MAHIRYGTFMHNVPDSRVDELEATIQQALRDGVGLVRITDTDDDVSTLFVSPGVPISIHSWDIPDLA